MPFGKYDTPKPPSKPTFLQYLKTCNKSVEGKTHFGVEIVWLPGKFNNVTLQTHAFRYVCDESHPLYNEMHEYCKTLGDKPGTKRLDIVIDSVEDKTIEIIESTRKSGTWEQLGSNAWKFKE